MDREEALRTLEFYAGSSPDLIAVPEFPEQNAFVLSPSQFLAAQCTRRAGKSNGLSLRYFRTMKKFAGCFCPYVALTRDSAKNIMWDILQEQADKFKIRASFTESNLTMTMTDSGSRLQLFGADMKGFIRRLKGIKTPGAAVDEAQDFGPHIESLVDDVLTPATADYGRDGWIALTGTPGPTPNGYFFDVTEKGKYGAEVHKWSLYQNPFMPEPMKFVERLIKKKGWTPENPTLQREWQNKWVLDLDALVYKFKRDRNVYSELPSGHQYFRILWVDYGWHDNAAIGITTYSPTLRQVFTEHAEAHPELIPSLLAKRVKELRETFSPMKMVADTGGLGKSITEEFIQRYHLPFEAAEKTEKKTAIRLMNGDFIDGHCLVHKSLTALQAQYEALKKPDGWKDNELLPAEKPGMPNDLCDGALYGYRAAKHFLGEIEEEEPPPNTPAAHEREAQRIMEADMEEFQKNKSKPWWEE